MPLPDSDLAIVEETKVCDYLLNREHPDGGTKAIWFYSLGYSVEEWDLLADDLSAIARQCEDYDTELTQFGIKYKASGLIGCPTHRPGKVLTVWIAEGSSPPRLVTAYPSADQ